MSKLRRFFVDKIEDVTVLSGEEYNHAINTLRIKLGEEIILCDNSGVDYYFEIAKIEKKSVSCKIIRKEDNNCQPKTDICLICGFLKGDKTELVCQKAVELGASKIVIFDSEYCSAYMNNNKLERLKRVVIEASKQCGRATYPQIIYEDSFEKAIINGENYQNKLFLCEFKNEHSEIAQRSLTGSTVVVVGSEGGFSLTETNLAFEKGYKILNLGNRILRAETACITAMSLVSFMLGEFD